MRNYILFFIVFILSIKGMGVDVGAQPRSSLDVEGKVIADTSGAPLSSANVAIVGKSRGTVTNENGRFVLAVDSLPVRLVISYIGYQTKKRRVSKEAADSVIVRLEAKPITMQEVVVEERTGGFYMQKALDHVRELSERRTAFTEGVRGFYRQSTGFYRQNSEKSSSSTSKKDTVFTEYIEIFYNAFTSPFGIRGWSINQGRYGTDDGPKYTVYFKNFSTLTSKWLSVPPYRTTEETVALQPSHSTPEEYFSFEIVGHVEQEGRDLVKIAYEPKQSLDKPAFSGHLFIDSETHALHHYEGTLHNQESLFFDFQGEARNVTLHFSISLRSLNDPSVTVVDRAHFDLSYDHLVADFRRRYKTTSTFFVYDYNPKETFGTSRIKHDYAAIDSVEYDPEFWRNNPVLARTPAEKAVIRSFEKTGGFGRFVEERVDSE